MANRVELRSDIAWSTPDRIGVHGYDLIRDIIGRVSFGDMAFLEITARLPEPRESRMFEAILVTLVEHGIVPSTLAARLTYDGAPESVQGAVAAGLLGLGSVFVGSMENAARMLSEALSDVGATEPLAPLAERIVLRYRDSRQIVPGIGHPLHKPADPRATRLVALAEEHGFRGRYVALMELVVEQAERTHGKPLPMNATGAIGALCCEMGLPWTVCRGIGVMARAVGLVGHILEESRRPIGVEVFQRTEEEASSHIRGKLREKA